MDNHYQLKALYDKKTQENEQKYKEASKRKLIESVPTRLCTVMIGALSRFEKEFGYLWHNNSSLKNKEQRELYDKWQKVRTEILDLGNKMPED